MFLFVDYLCNYSIIYNGIFDFEVNSMINLSGAIKKVTDFVTQPVNESEVFGESTNYVDESNFTEGNTALKPEYKSEVTEHSTPEPKSKKNKESHLKVVEPSRLNVVVYQPKTFCDTRYIANALSAGKAVVINFDQVNQEEQIRICDFMNGACYVLKASVQRISNFIVMYLPSSVQFGDNKK